MFNLKITEMKKLILKGLVLLAILSFNTVDASAQGFLKKLKKGAEAVVSNNAEAEQPVDSIAVNDLLENVPVYQVNKVVFTDKDGKELTNEDGSVKYAFFVVDSITGKVCTVDHAKKIVNARLKEVGKILGKVGGGALLGGLASGDAKGALVGAGAGAAKSIADGDFKRIGILNKSLKKYKDVLEDYEKTFTDVGTPKDANVDLKDYEDCPVVNKTLETTIEELKQTEATPDALENIGAIFGLPNENQ